MRTAVIVVVSTAGGMGLYAAARWFIEQRNWLEQRRCDKVIVHTTDKVSLGGVLMSTGRDGIVLTAVRYLEDEGVELGGEVFVPREKVSFMQTTS